MEFGVVDGLVGRGVFANHQGLASVLAGAEVGVKLPEIGGECGGLGALVGVDADPVDVCVSGVIAVGIVGDAVSVASGIPEKNDVGCASGLEELVNVLPGSDEIGVNLLSGSCAGVVAAGLVAVVGVDEIEFPEPTQQDGSGVLGESLGGCSDVGVFAGVSGSDDVIGVDGCAITGP